jgi:hypothetical protein
MDASDKSEMAQLKVIIVKLAYGSLAMMNPCDKQAALTEELK